MEKKLKEEEKNKQMILNQKKLISTKLNEVQSKVKEELIKSKVCLFIYFFYFE